MKKRISDTQKKTWKDPEIRAKRVKAISLAMKKKWKDPAFMVNRLRTELKPEMRAKHSVIGKHSMTNLRIELFKKRMKPFNKKKKVHNRINVNHGVVVETSLHD